jgi:hypothetical protein
LFGAEVACAAALVFYKYFAIAGKCCAAYQVFYANGMDFWGVVLL